MSITIRPPAFTDWQCKTGTLTQSGETVTLTGASSTLTCTVTDLVPNMPLAVRLTVSADGPAPVVIIGTKATALINKYQTMVINTVCDGTMTINITGATSVTVYKVEITAPGDQADDATPAQVLSLQAYFPLRGLEGFRLDSSRLGRAALTKGLTSPAAFTLNRDVLNSQRLYYKAANVAWQDITGPVTSIQVKRGISATGPVYTAQAGTLTARALDALDPRETGLTYGAPVILIHWPSRTRLFTGTVSGIELDREPPGSRRAYTVTFTVSDAVRRLSSIKRYGARSEGGDGSETWNDRIARLMRSAPEVPYRIASTTYQRMCATVWETSLAKHLDAAAASVIGSWIVARDGTVIISSARPSASPLVFSDVQKSDGKNVFAYTNIETSWNSTDVVSSVNATNHGAQVTEGEWRANDKTLTISEETYSQTWAGATASVDLTCISEDAARAAARALVDKASDVPTPQEITLRPAHSYGPVNAAALMALAAQLDPLTPARVENRSDTTRVIITEVSHNITPDSWETRLSFSPQR